MPDPLKWKCNDRELSESVQWLLSQQLPNGGWKAGGRNDLAIRELATSLANPRALSDGEVMTILGKLAKSDTRDVERFRKLVTEQLARPSTNKPVKWRFFLPMIVNVDAALRLPITLFVEGQRFRIVSRKYVERAAGVKNLSDEVVVGKFLEWPASIPNYFLQTEASESSWRRAWDRAEPAFDTLKGLLEVLAGTRTIRGGLAEFEPRANLPHPSWMLCIQGKEIEGVNFVVEYRNPPAPRINFTPQSMKAIRRWTAIVRKKPDHGTTLEVIASALRLYGQAVHRRFPHLCFLGLWQVAETITLSETGNTREVSKRLAWHSSRCGLPGSGFRNTLLNFGDRRNDIVHRGLHGIDHEDLNLLDAIIDVALGWLIRERSRLPTRDHLEVFYRLAAVGIKPEGALQSAARYVISQSSASSSGGRKGD